MKLLLFLIPMLTVGCSTVSEKRQLDKLSLENAELRKSIKAEKMAHHNMMANKEMFSNEKMSDLPEFASAGQCFTKVITPAKYEYTSKKVMVVPERTNFKTSAAKYRYVNKSVVVKQASEKVIAIPATYRWETDRVKVRDAATKLVQVPAQYKTVSERMLVSPEREVWKRGEPTEVNENGVLCKVKIPAKYKTVYKKQLVREAKTLERTIPAAYQTMRRKVVATPASYKTVSIPAVTKVVRVKELVEPAKSYSVNSPAEFKTIQERKMVAESKVAWAPILCKTNATASSVSKVQKALKLSGYNPGRIDGVLGEDTARAIKNFQRRKKLAQGGLTLETLKALKVNL